MALSFADLLWSRAHRTRLWRLLAEIVAEALEFNGEHHRMALVEVAFVFIVIAHISDFEIEAFAVELKTDSLVVRRVLLEIVAQPAEYAPPPGELQRRIGPGLKLIGRPAVSGRLLDVAQP